MTNLLTIVKLENHSWE